MAILCALLAPGGAGAAPSVDPVSLVLPSAAFEAIVSASLPLVVALPGGRAKEGAGVVIGDVRHCGVTARGAARLRALVQGAGKPGVARVTLPAGAEGCRPASAAVAKRVLEAAGEEAIAVLELSALIEGRALVGRIDQVAIATAKGKAAPEGWRTLEAATAPLPLLTLEPIRIPLEDGATLGLAASLEFAGDAVSARVGLVEDGPPGAAPARVDKPDAAAVRIPSTFANHVLARLYDRTPVVVPVGQDTVHLTNFRVEGNAAVTIVKATARHPSIDEPLRVTMEASGADLQIASVKAQASLEDCKALGLVERLACASRNAVRDAAAATFASAVASRYRGQLLRTLLGTRAFSFQVERHTVEVTLEPRRISGVSDGVQIFAGARVRLLP